MKKYLTLFFTILLVFMTACSDDTSINAVEESGDTVSNENDNGEGNAKAEVTASKYYEWHEEATDTETITVYAEIKNTGNVNIDAGRAKITYLDSGGDVIAVNDAQVSPRFLNEGSAGYISTEIEDGIDKYEDLDDIEVEVSPEPFQDAEIVEFTTKGKKLNVDTWGEKNSKISVTGFFENESDVNFIEDDTSAVVGLYDEDNNFLASESMYQDQGFSVDANGETSFEVAGGSPLPPEIGEEVDHAEVKAIGIENMEDYWW